MMMTHHQININCFGNGNFFFLSVVYFLEAACQSLLPNKFQPRWCQLSGKVEKHQGVSFDDLTASVTESVTWRWGKPIKASVPVQRDGLHLVSFLSPPSGPKRTPEPSAPRDQLNSSTHDSTTTFPSADELPTANQVTTQKESQSYRMSGIENFSILGKFHSPLKVLHDTGWGEGRLLAMLVLAGSLFRTL